MKKILILATIFVLFGCFGHTPNSKFYLLENLKETAVVSTKNVNIAVTDINLPVYLQKPQIILQNGSSPELDVSEFNRWASDLTSMLQNTLIEDLQQAFPNAEIKTLLYGSHPQFIVKVNIEKLSGWLGKKALLNGSFQIVNAQNKVLAEQNFAKKASAGKTYETYVKAQSKLWAEVAAEIATRIKGLM